MPQQANLYEILGLPRYASIEDVRHTFRRLAVLYHPDKNPGNAAAEETFKQISNAYDVLGDEKKKTDYDLRLSGFYKYLKEESPEEKKRKRQEEVQRMRQKIKEREEREIKNKYTKARKFMPYVWRYIISAICLLTGIVLIIDHWYLYNLEEHHNSSFFIMFFGYVLMTVACIFFLGSLFVKWNAVNIDKPFKFDIRNRITIYFVIFMIFIGWFSANVPGYYKKYHLSQFGKSTVGVISNIGGSTITIDYYANGKNYQIYLYDNQYQFRDVVEVQYSEKRPYIMRILRKIE